MATLKRSEPVTSTIVHVVTKMVKHVLSTVLSFWKLWQSVVAQVNQFSSPSQLLNFPMCPSKPGSLDIFPPSSSTLPPGKVTRNGAHWLSSS
jgi:hypothetical protein